ADQAHVAVQHVQELRQLVQARPPEKAAGPRDAWVVVRLVAARTALLSKPGRGGGAVEVIAGAVPHRPQLPDGKWPAAPADPHLGENDRAVAGQPADQ